MRKNTGESMKNILIATILMLPVVAAASTEQTASPFPNAKKGINIVPMSEIQLPATMKKQMLKNRTALATKGYNDTTETDQDVLSLLSIQKTAKEETVQFDNSANPYDTHLKSSLSKLKLSFGFSGIPGIAKGNILGFAAAGGYGKGKGWDGVVEFVSIQKLGICSFTTYAIEKAILDKETLQYLVNRKPSNEDVSGNWNTGFLYTLNWYNPDRLMTLQCANKVLNPGNLDQMVNIAKQIDKNL